MSKQTLEFEKPIAELEQKIEEMRKLSDHLDIEDEIEKPDSLATRSISASP
jgi:acetyl-CoA carboxylase alpha subunit